MDSKFLLRAKQAQQSVWKTIVAVKKTPKRNSQRENAQTRNGDFKRVTRITMALIPLRKK